jgi:FeS assembly protein SufD
VAVEALKTKAEQGFADQFAAAKANLPGDSWVQGLRETAWGVYAAAGLPHRRVEEWKYTDLRSLLSEAYPPAPVLAEALTADALAQALGPELGTIDCHRLVVLDGQLRTELSDIEDFAGKGEVLGLADALAAPPSWLKETLGQVNPQKDDRVIALNIALMAGGIALRVDDGAAFDKPVHIVHVHAAKEAAAMATRNVIRIGAGAALTLLESYVSRSSAPVQRNAVTELDIGDGAKVRHVKYQNEGLEGAHLGSWLVRLGADSDYRALQFSTGAGLARNQIYVAFAGEGATSHINGAVMARGKQHNDTTMVIDHAVPGCESREFNKLVLDGEARGIVQCKVNVHRDAQKSDGHQMAHGLLLSERAEFDSKPELEIFADDVVCGHGSTSGDLEEESMFYLRSRGIPEPEARALLIAAFVAEAIERLDDAPVRDAFLALAGQWLSAGEEA